jgi:acyl-CoA reductase-like NAD-dependent aldehyde dehydrogenase
LKVYGTSKKSVPELGGSTPNLVDEDAANQVYVVFEMRYFSVSVVEF